LPQTAVNDLFRPAEVAIDSVAMRAGAGVPGGQEYVTRRLLGDLVRGTSQPVLVRPVGIGYEIIAGDVEYLAARKRGSRTIKVLVGDVSGRDALLMRLLEGSRRGDLNPVEEAEIVRELNVEFGLTQQEIAMRCDRVQSTVANKMRLLKLPGDVLESLRRGEIGERHARALLKLGDAGKQSEMFRRVVRMRASAAEVESMCDVAAGVPKSGGRRGRSGKGVVKDARIYQNSLRAVVREMRKAGLRVTCDEETSDKLWEFRVQLKTGES
jgi:ParB family chromosome partitioning protein